MTIARTTPKPGAALTTKPGAALADLDLTTALADLDLTDAPAKTMRAALRGDLDQGPATNAARADALSLNPHDVGALVDASHWEVTEWTSGSRWTTPPVLTAVIATAWGIADRITNHISARAALAETEGLTYELVVFHRDPGFHAAYPALDRYPARYWRAIAARVAADHRNVILTWGDQP